MVTDRGRSSDQTLHLISTTRRATIIMKFTGLREKGYIALPLDDHVCSSDARSRTPSPSLSKHVIRLASAAVFGTALWVLVNGLESVWSSVSDRHESTQALPPFDWDRVGICINPILLGSC